MCHWIFKFKQPKDQPHRDDLQKFAEMLSNPDEKVQQHGIQELKQALKAVLFVYESFIGMVEKILSLEILPKIVEFLGDKNKHPELRYDCIWMLINLCCADASRVKQVIDLGGLNSLIEVIAIVDKTLDPDQIFIDMAFESVWAIGNIVTDSLEYRDICLEKEAPQKIVSFFSNKKSLRDKLNRMGIWGLSRLVDMKPAPSWNQISDTLPFFLSIIKSAESSEDMVRHALWGIYYISNAFLLNIFESEGCISLLVNFLEHENLDVSFPALKILGNIIASGRDSLLDEVLKNEGFIEKIFNIYSSPHEDFQVYAGWILCNIAAGSSDQIAKILEQPKFVNKLGEYLKDENEKVKYQASCALANLVSRATHGQILKLVAEHHYLDYFASFMKEKHVQIYERNIIEPIHKVMKADTTNTIAPIFKHMGLIEQMKNISPLLSSDMKGLADEIFKTYFENHASPLKKVSRAPKSKKIQKLQNSSGSAAQKAFRLKKRQTRKVIAKQKLLHRVIRRTNTIDQVIQEAQEIVKGVLGRTRQSKIALAAKVKKANEKRLEQKQSQNDEKRSLLKSSRKIKRTNSMKQTLGEAK